MIEGFFADGYWLGQSTVKIPSAGENRFESDADHYAAYLDTPEGRLRADLTFENLQEFLPPQDRKSLCALDLGCGNGASGLKLAHLGFYLTLLDSSPAMLQLAERSANETGLAAQITLRHADAALLTDNFQARSFDVILCHNLLEFVEDPVAVLRGAARLMRDSSAVLSVLVRNQAGEVVKAALQAGDLAAAEQNLDAEWGQESLYLGKVRLFTAEMLEAVLEDASLTPIARKGVRVISDYLPPQISRTAEYERILALERRLCSRKEFVGVARYLHFLARQRTSGAGAA